MPKRQPRCPSWIEFVHSSPGATGFQSLSVWGLGWWLRALDLDIRSFAPGRNSCNGGSSVRMVTGNPSIARNYSDEVRRGRGSQFLSAARRSSRVGQDHRPHVGQLLLAEEHVLGCGKAIPSAPKARAWMHRVECRRSPRTTQLAERLGPTHELHQFRIIRLRRHGAEFALDHGVRLWPSSESSLQP